MGLKIVQVAPDVYPVPPKDYGGTEVVIYELAEELVRRGHEVYLYAQEGSKTSAKLIPYKVGSNLGSVGIMKYVTDTLPDNIDIFHYHTHPSIISSKCNDIPSLCTIHGPGSVPCKCPVFVSRRALELSGFAHGHYVYNGLDFGRYEFSESKEDYLLFIGRIVPDKGLHFALDVAEKTGQKLVIAGPVHDFEYYKTLIEPRILNNPNVEYVGSVAGAKKQNLLKHAKCMLFPIGWEEPFGLVMTETFASGTPVLAFPFGSVPEVLGGFPDLICKDVDEMAQKVLENKFPAPKDLRKYVEDNFSVKAMTDKYLEIYDGLTAKQKPEYQEVKMIEPITISLCMIVKNEEDTLAECLSSVKDMVDEIVIVDTGSSDKTKEIAGRFTEKVYDFEWIDDFSAARNFSFSKATKEYILWLDADDVLLEEDRLKFFNLKHTIDKNLDVVMMKYNYSFDAEGNVTLSHFRERLLKREREFKWIDPIHECIDFKGRVMKTDICVTHKKRHTSSTRNLRILQKMEADGKEFSPRNLFYYARELHINGLYDDAIIYFNKFLDTKKGTKGENVSSCVDLANCFDAKKDKENVLKTLLRSLEYDVLRAEICCGLGYYYKSIQDYEKAIFWFGLAPTLKKPDDTWTTVRQDYSGFIPYFELCICNYRMGNFQAAIENIERAASFKPNDARVKRNIELLKHM